MNVKEGEKEKSGKQEGNKKRRKRMQIKEI